jgi:general secretion pathway protein M
VKININRQTVAAILLLVALSLPFVVAGAYLVSKYRWAGDRLAELEPRYARMTGLEASRAELSRALSGSVDVLGRYVYPASQDVSQAGNDAQTRVRDISTKAGLTLVSSQVLPARAEGPFDRIPLTVRLEGDLPAMQAALVVLLAQTPALNFEGFSVQTIGAVKPEVQQRLNIQFNLFVLRARP